MTDDPILTTGDVSELINTTEATLRVWRYRHIGPRWFRLGPRKIAYKRSDVVAWLETQYSGEISEQRAGQAIA